MSTTDDSTRPNDADIEESFTSELQFRTLKLNWMIKDIEFVFKNIKAIESPRFPSTKSEKVKWYIRLELTELKVVNKEKVKIYLKNTDNSKRHLKVDIYFFDSSRQIDFFYEDFDNFDQSSGWSVNGEDLYSKLLLNKDKLLLKNMTVICVITFIDSGKNVSKKPLDLTLSSESIKKQFGRFYDDQIFKDVKFIVENKEFSAHKTILAFRSPVFAAILKSKMSEESPSVVEIKDIKPTIFQSMLQFIYTDEVQALEECALELFYAAERYQLERLKKLCINSLYTNMSIETVVKIFELSDIFSISKLKNKAGEFLVSCLKAVQYSEEFQNLFDRRPHLAAEIVKLQKNDNCEIEVYENLHQDMKFELRS